MNQSLMAELLQRQYYTDTRCDESLEIKKNLFASRHFAACRWRRRGLSGVIH
jgi:hypothetical protein